MVSDVNRLYTIVFGFIVEFQNDHAIASITDC